MEEEEKELGRRRIRWAFQKHDSFVPPLLGVSIDAPLSLRSITSNQRRPLWLELETYLSCNSSMIHYAMMRDSKDHRVKMLHNNNKKKVAQ